MTRTKMYRFDRENHWHLLNEKRLTGTSSVCDVVAKNLTWWAAELAAVECLERGEKIPTIREEYEVAAKSENKKKAIDELQKKYPAFKIARFAHFDSKNKAAKKGTNLHEELEKFVRSEMGLAPAMSFAKEIEPYIEWSRKNVERYEWSEAHTYSERLWVGGITDAGAILKDGSLAVIDFKSAKIAYKNHFIQAAGYAIQVDESALFNADGTQYKIIEQKVDTLIIVPFGAEKVVPVVEKDITKYKEGFEAATRLYRLIENEL